MCRRLCVLALAALYVRLAHSWDIAVSYGEFLEFYTNETKTDTVRFNSQNLTALAYDEVHNMMLYVDKQTDNDTICGYDISSTQYKYVTERNGRNIHGLAFDPVTELLFFTDTNERSVNWISLKPGSEDNIKGNILIKMDEGIPTDIAVDSCRGYVYWINTNLTTPKIERARFNGSEREVVINSSVLSISTTYKLVPHSLAINQRTQKIYWLEPDKTSFTYSMYRADLNGKNKANVPPFDRTAIEINVRVSNRFAVSKKSFFRASLVSGYVWGYPNTDVRVEMVDKIYESLSIPAGIAANYKISEQIQGFQDCAALTSLVRINSLTSNPFKTATEYDRPFCVHGIKVNGQSLCKCTPGYIGERCDVSVCENYCFQGYCSFNDEGLPKCRCNAGYIGERCEVDACYGYCLNNGDCSLNEKSEPVCQCKGDYLGDRCGVSECLNYCFQGICSLNDEGLPTCRCNAGYSGERCEVNVCYGYCLNNGDCSLNEEDKPFCQCVGNHDGSRCEAVKNDSFANTLKYSPADRTLTLADLFSNWRKPISKISVTVEA